MSLRKLRESTKKIIAFKQEYKCAHCKNMLPPSFQVDHIIPFSLTCDNSEENLQILCANCHSLKTQLEYYRISQFKKLKINYTSSNDNIDMCWFCLETFHKKCDVKHKCSKVLKNIDSIVDNKEIKEIETMLKRCSKRERTDESFEILCNSYKKLKIEEREEREYGTILNVKITPEYVSCKDKTYKIENVDEFTLDHLGEIIFNSTRTKKDSKRFNEINIIIEVEKSEEYEITCEKMDKFSDFIVKFLPEYLPERIIKDEFLIINVE